MRGDELGGSSRVGDLPGFGEVFGSRETPGFAGVTGRGALGGIPGPSGIGGLASGCPTPGSVRPEEPARYISELPKLSQADLANSAVVCGNWLAQVRQIMVGLSTSATIWWQGVETPAMAAYRRWLAADPLGRLGLDPSTVQGEFDRVLYGRVESRSVSLLLAAVPQSIRDDVVTNRWLSSAAILFRVLCLFQPGGSSERSHLLSQLVSPAVCKSFTEAIKGLRTWQQGLQKAGEIQATLPDPSLLLRGVDSATASLLSAHPMIGFRVNAFRHQLAIDYNPTVATVVQLVRLIQAECEAASITQDGGVDRRAKAAAAAAAVKEQATSKATPVPPPPPPVPQVAAASVSTVEGPEKGKAKGKGLEPLLCHKFGDSSGCRFGDSCRFKHDRAKARRESRCLACGQPGHFRPECTLVPPEHRQIASDTGSEASPKAGAQKGSAKGKAKAKAGAQANGVIEESNPKSEGARVSPTAGASGSAASAVNPEALVAEATKLLKGVSLRAVRAECELDFSWLRSALLSASDPGFCLIDSGATNALRPAGEGESENCRVIRVDLASGGTELRINDFGTLLHHGECQVILPASYLVDLGYVISWRRGGCKVKHRRLGALDVTVVKGCPLIPRSEGLRLLEEYEARKRGDPVVSKTEAHDLLQGIEASAARQWFRDRVQLRGEDGVSEVDQLVYLRSLFPEIPLRVLARVCVPALKKEGVDWSESPWNRRLRRSVARSERRSVMISIQPSVSSWKGFGRVVPVADTERGLGSRLVFSLLMEWARQGVIGGLVKGPSEGGAESFQENGDEDELVRTLRFLLVFATAQAALDAKEGESIPGIGELRESGSRISRTQVFLAMNPRSPVSTPLVDQYALYTASFDQGCLGVLGIKETSVITSSWFLYETLHELRVGDQLRSVFLEFEKERGTGFSGEKIKWETGLFTMVQRAWVLWKWERANEGEVAERRAILKKLTEEESYALHVQHDHVPYRRGCPICISAQGRQRSHWRSGFPGMHSLSVDIAGPLISGRSWDVEASGRDKGGGYKYFLACAYAIPGGFAPTSPGREGLKEGAEGSEETGHMLR